MSPTGGVRTRLSRVLATPERQVGVGLVLLLGLVVLGTRFGQTLVDTRPDLYLAPGRLIDESLSSWASGGSLGSPNYDPGYLPVAVVIRLLELGGCPPWLAMRIWRFALYVVAGLGARALYRQLAGRQSTAAGRVAVTVLYVANPYVVVGGATTPLLLPYALLPWLLLALRRSMNQVGRWVGVAAFVLVFFAMSGINAGVVPLFLLLAVPLVAVDAVWREGRPLRTVLSGTVASLVGAAGVSAYWLAASVTALGAGETVAASSETPESVASVTSFAEVLRGLGQWPLYGADAAGPFRPGFTAYVDNALVVVLTFGLPILAFVGVMVSRSRVRLLGVALVVLGAVVTVGLHPPKSPSPFGRLLAWFFHDVPGGIAFRTTFKVGAVLLLGLALLAALAAEWAARRLRTSGVRVAAGAAATVLLLGLVAPVPQGNLMPGTFETPDYWRQAARDLDARAGAGRVWFVPGGVSATYRWGRRSVDDLGPSLLARDSIVRTTVPNVPAEAANSLAAVDSALQSGQLPPGALSAFARYYAVGDVLVRNDVVWEHTGGARPASLMAAVGRDPGLVPGALFGRPGQFVQANTAASNADYAASRLEQLVFPLARYDVASRQAEVRGLAAGGTVLVVGDNAAAVELAGFGLLDGDRQFRLLAGLPEAQAQREVREGARIVLTDSNRRRESNDRRLDAGGVLQPPSRRLRTTRVLYDPADQTVAAFEGVADVDASTSGSVFGPVAFGSPPLAVDGDPATSWQTGSFGSAVGEWIRMRFAEPREVQRVEVTRNGSSPVTLASVVVSVGGVSRRLDLSDGTGVADFPAGTRGDAITVTIARTSGAGANAVGISEIRIPGVSVRQVTQLPRTLTRLGLDEGLRETPVDVLVSRAAAGEGEVAVNRRFELPVGRTYLPVGRLSGADLGDDVLARLEGVDAATSVRASSAGFSGAADRPAQAFDGDPLTMWVPTGTLAGQWLEARFKERDLASIRVRLPVDRLGRSALTRLRLVVDGQPQATVAVRSGVADWGFTSRRVTSVRVEVVEASTVGDVGVAEVEVGAAPSTPDVVARQCVPVATVDGQVVRLALVGPAEALSAPGGASGRACSGDPVRLTVGTHELRAQRELTLESLWLVDQSRPIEPPQAPGRVVLRWTEGAGTWRVSLADSADETDLVVAEAYDRRWRAQIDGRDLGPAERVNGFAMAWRIPAGGPAVVTLRYTPQRWFRFGLFVSGLVLAASTAVLVRAGVRVRRRRRMVIP